MLDARLDGGREKILLYVVLIIMLVPTEVKPLTMGAKWLKLNVRIHYENFSLTIPIFHFSGTLDELSTLMLKPFIH